MHGSPEEAPVLPLHCIYHGYSLPRHRKTIQQKLKFLISMLQGPIFIFRAAHSLRKIVIVSLAHSWNLRCPAEDTPSTKSQLSCSCVSDALLSSPSIRWLQENVSCVTYCSWTPNVPLFCRSLPSGVTQFSSFFLQMAVFSTYGGEVTTLK